MRKVRRETTGTEAGDVDDRHVVRICVNGQWRGHVVEARWNLADFLRQALGLTGTHVGCEHGVCGACTVLVDGDSVRACLMLAVQANGSRVETVEGLDPLVPGGTLHPVQGAFHRHHALQCGFCTPGMLLTVIDLLRKCRLDSDDAIREGLSGNLCRCTGYENIVAAVRSVVRARDATLGHEDEPLEPAPARAP